MAVMLALAERVAVMVDVVDLVLVAERVGDLVLDCAPQSAASRTAAAAAARSPTGMILSRRAGFHCTQCFEHPGPAT